MPRGRTTHSVNLPTPKQLLRRYLLTATLARAGLESAGPAVLVVSIAVLGSASQGAYIAASLTAAAAIGGPFVGALLDRTQHPRRGFTILMMFTAVGLTALGLALGKAPLWLVMSFAVIAGIGYPAVTGAWTAQLGRIVPHQMLARAYAADAGTYSLAAIIGPPLAASLVVWSTSAPIAIPVIAVMVAIVLLRFVPLQPAAKIQQHSLLADLRFGFATIAKRAALRRTTIMSVVGFAGEAALFVSAPILAQATTGSLAFTGVILGARAAGGIVIAGFLIRRPINHPDRALAWGVLTIAVTFTLMAIMITPVVIVLGAFVTGLAHSFLLAAMFQVRNRESSDRVRSQVFTTSASLRMTAFAAATAIFGSLITFGPGAVLLIGAAVNVAALLIGIIAGPHVPHHRRTLRRPPSHTLRT